MKTKEYKNLKKKRLTKQIIGSTAGVAGLCAATGGVVYTITKDQIFSTSEIVIQGSNEIRTAKEKAGSVIFKITNAHNRTLNPDGLTINNWSLKGNDIPVGLKINSSIDDPTKAVLSWTDEITDTRTWNFQIVHNGGEKYQKTSLNITFVVTDTFYLYLEDVTELTTQQFEDLVGTKSSVKIVSDSLVEIQTYYARFLRDLDLSECPNIEKVECGIPKVFPNFLTSLNVKGCTNLIELSCDNTDISSLDVSTSTKLEYLSCNNTNISSLDVSKNTKLEYLSCDNNSYDEGISSLDVTANTKLKHLSCNGAKKISSLDLSAHTELEYISFSGTNVSSLDTSMYAELKYFSCSNSGISTIDVTKNVKLETLLCDGLSISSLDVSKNVNLENLHCEYNNLSSIDLSNNTLLNILYCYGNVNITTLDLSNTNVVAVNVGGIVKFLAYDCTIRELTLSKKTTDWIFYEDYQNGWATSGDRTIYYPNTISETNIAGTEYLPGGVGVNGWQLTPYDPT